MKKSVLLFVLIAQISWAQFVTTRHPATYKGKQVIVGQVVKGIAQEYILTADGGVYRHLGTAANYEKLGDQTPKNIKAVFKSLDDVKFTATEFNHVLANKKSFFVILKEGSKQHKVAWGDAKFKIPEDVQRVYDAFMGMIPANVRY